MSTTKGLKRNFSVFPQHLKKNCQILEFAHNHKNSCSISTSIQFPLSFSNQVVGEFIPTWRAYGNQGDIWTKARIQITAEVAFRGYQVCHDI